MKSLGCPGSGVLSLFRIEQRIRSVSDTVELPRLKEATPENDGLRYRINCKASLTLLCIATSQIQLKKTLTFLMHNGNLLSVRKQVLPSM